MNKLCLPFRHLFFIFLAFISLSFSFTSKVEAITSTITFDSDYSFYTNSNYSNLLTWLDSDSRSGKPYAIFKNNNGEYHVLVGNSSTSESWRCTYTSSLLRCVFPTSINGSDYRINLSDYSTSWVANGGFGLYIHDNLTPQGVYIIKTNFDIIYGSMWNDSLTITDGTYTHTCSTNSSCAWISKDTFYMEYYYVPPVPPDDTPLLTSFYETTIDRLSYLCDYIVNSYIYLAIFSIFILYFVILLIRRLR